MNIAFNGSSREIIRNILFICVILLFSTPAFADTILHSQTTIIPTKYRFLLLDLAGSENQITANKESFAPASIANIIVKPEREPDFQDEDIGALISNSGNQPSFRGMGRGYVETNFAVSMDEPGRKVDNRERLTARGLFDVHVIHEFN